MNILLAMGNAFVCLLPAIGAHLCELRLKRGTYPPQLTHGGAGLTAGGIDSGDVSGSERAPCVTQRRSSEFEAHSPVEAMRSLVC